jgi:hypothetical protein
MSLLARRQSDLLPLLSAALVGVLAGAIATSSYHTIMLALAAGALVAAFACVRAELYVFALAATLLVPYTWSPTLNHSAQPAIMLLALPGALVAAAVLARRGRLRPCVLDYLVVAIFVSALLSEIAVASGSGILGSTTLSHNEVEVILLPYFAFRLILAIWPQTIPRLPFALILAGAGLSIVAITEEVTHTNFFANSPLNNPNLAVWEHTFPRAGSIRADATMGHPIALGTFLVIPLVFAFAERRWGLFSLLAVGEALTLSRGPYVAVFVAILLCSVLTKRLGRMWILVVVAALIAASVGPVRNSVLNSFEAGSKEQKTANYRSELLSTSLNTLSLWGKPTGKTDELFSHQSEFNLPDVTSEFAIMAGRQGVFGTVLWVSFLAAFVYLIREGRRRGDELLLLLGVALTGLWIALLSVALITSFQYMFWLAVAMAAERLSPSIKQVVRHRGGFRRLELTPDALTGA